MPRNDSILFTTSDPDEWERDGCCQFLHTTPEDYNGVVILQYLASHMNTTEEFKKWMDFLNKDLELNLSYSLKELEVTGWKSLKQAQEVYNKYKGKFVLPPPPDKAHKGVYIRAQRSDFTIIGENNKLIITTYNSGSLFAPARGKYLGSHFYKEDLPKFTVPCAIVALPTDLEPEQNSFKYISWYMIRLYNSYRHLINFILDNKEKLNDIRIKYDLGWWNIIFALLLIFPFSNFCCHTSKKLTKADIETALRNESESYDNFDYIEHEIYIAGAMERYCGEKQSAMIGYAYTSHDNWFVDSPSGHPSIKESTVVLNKINSYFAKLTDK